MVDRNLSNVYNNLVGTNAFILLTSAATSETLKNVQTILNDQSSSYEHTKFEDHISEMLQWHGFAALVPHNLTSWYALTNSKGF